MVVAVACSLPPFLSRLLLFVNLGLLVEANMLFKCVGILSCKTFWFGYKTIDDICYIRYGSTKSFTHNYCVL